MTVLGGEGAEGGSTGAEGGSTGAEGGAASAGGQAGGQGAAQGDTSGATKTWRDSLPENLKNDPSLLPFSDLTNFAQSYISTKAMVGKKGVIPPAANATDEDWGRFYKDLGQPEIDKFELKAPAEHTVSEDAINNFKAMAHKNGLLPKQAQALLNEYTAAEAATNAAEEAAIAKESADALTALKSEWGDGYSKQLALAQLGVNEVGGADFKTYLEETGLGDDPVIIKMMAKVGKILGEDKIRGEGGGAFGQTPAEIASEHSKLQGELWSLAPSDPRYKPLLARVEDLAKKRWGT